MGKVIKTPGSLAEEYGKYSFYAYYGCSNGCDYCYLKYGRFGSVLGTNKPTLKTIFKDESDVMKQMEADLVDIEDLKRHGVFFCFNTDPFLAETHLLTIRAVCHLNRLGIPVKILSKRVDYYPTFFEIIDSNDLDRSIIALGQTITGFDEREPNASPNQARCNGLYNAKMLGYKTFVSFEPILDINTTWRYAEEIIEFCDHFKVGIEKGGEYDAKTLSNFTLKMLYLTGTADKSVYFKDSLLDYISQSRPFGVDKYFNMFDYGV